MKHISIFLISLLMGLATAQADNLLPYVQTNLHKAQVLAFSGQGLSIKECDSCPAVSLLPSGKVSYWAQNQEVNLKTATEFYVRGNYSFIAVFYNRSSRQYDKVMFDGYNELMPLHHKSAH